MMTRILVDHMPDSPRDCFVAGHQNSGNWTCGFQGYVMVCNPERCPYLAEAKSDTRDEEDDVIAWMETPEEYHGE